MKFVIFISGFLSLIACDKGTKNLDSAKELDKVIAKVEDKVLYESEVSNLYQGDIPQDEKNILIKGFVSNWIRDQLMILEAEKNIPPDFNIESKVKDYRASLILNNYENKLVNELLDTTVTLAQLESFYDQAQSEFLLSEPIVKVLAVRVIKSSNQKNTIEKEIDKMNLSAIQQSITNEGTILSESKIWKSIGEVKSQLPPEKFSSTDFSKKNKITQTDGEYQYYVKVIDYVDKNQVPPLEYIKPKIKQIILNNRKKALLKRKKQQLYDQNYNNNKIEINI